MDLEVGDIVLCTVDRIVGTTVFVHIAHEGRDLEGSIVFSEVAPGRIRNIRDYVVPKKKLVCKVLRISGDRIDLSLRRVTQKEQKELKQKDKQEKSFISIIKAILKNDAGKVLDSISKENISDFIEEISKDSKKLDKLAGKEDSKKILDALKSQKQKKSIVKKEISLKSTEPEGIEKIKQLLGNLEGIEVKYLSAGKYSLKKETEDLKEADQKLRDILETLEKSTKNKEIEFSILKK